MNLEFEMWPKKYFIFGN